MGTSVEDGCGSLTEEPQGTGSSTRLITAPHVHVIQTRSGSTASSSSPQYSCSRMKASRASPSEAQARVTLALRGSAGCMPGGGAMRGSCSLEHLVRSQEERLRDREPERLGGLEVDDELKFCCLLDRQVGWFGALQNLIDVGGGKAPMLQWARTIAQQTSRVYERSTQIHRRQFGFHGQLDKLVSVRWSIEWSAAQLNECPGFLLSHRPECFLKVLRRSDRHRQDREAETPRCSLNCRELGRMDGVVVGHEDGHARGLRSHSVQQ